MKKIKIVAFVSAVITAVLIYIFLNSLSRPLEIAKTRVITASVDIPNDTPITEKMLTVKDIPTEGVTVGAITDISQVLGKISEEKIFAGEQILNSRIISAGNSGSGSLAYAIKPGMRAITIAVDQTSGLSNMITPGNHVDLIGQFLTETALENGTKQKKSYTTMIMENIIVLAVDNVLSEDGKTKNETPTYTTITLQVTQKQAMELTMAQFEGQIKAILRSPVDEKETKLPSLTLDNIMVK